MDYEELWRRCRSKLVKVQTCLVKPAIVSISVFEAAMLPAKAINRCGHGLT